MIKEIIIRKVGEVSKQVKESTKELYEIWIQYSLFTVEWWIGIGLVIIPWILWIILHKRQSRGRLLFAGLFVTHVSCWLDFIGSTIGLWFYPLIIFPTIPSFLLWDMTMLPVTIMFLLQYTYRFHPFLIAIIFAGMTAFIGEPVFQWLDFYKMVNWKHIYSFPIYIVIYLAAYRISRTKSFEQI